MRSKVNGERLKMIMSFVREDVRFVQKVGMERRSLRESK